ncbi:MAG: cytochrome c3 family protein [Polyangiales bacterium]
MFPRWTNKTPAIVLALVTGGAITAGAALTYYGTDKHFAVGYQPTQPVDYSHKLHAGDMGIDCRYCHVNVEKGMAATVPATQTCMNCHWKVKTDSLKLLPVRESFASNQPIPWIRVHKLPDYVYFPHSTHVAAGVGCSSCHGRIDQMPKVTQVQPLSMGWCLECHRQPGGHLRDPKDITKMDWKPAQPADQAPIIAAGPADPYYGKQHADAPVLKTGRKVSPPLHCSGCHR